MNDKKIKLGQFFTKESLWLKPQVKNFIINCGCTIAYDPFAGAGDLLNVAKAMLNFDNVFGLDIDETLQWEYNDSLLSIPSIKNAIIITNPPYIAKQSASRKKIDLSKYFSTSTYDDVYLIALDKMLASQQYVVAIVPESFINSSYRQKDKLFSITVLEENPFEDTENPVCVVCFDNTKKPFDEIKVYKNQTLVSSFLDIQKIRIEPKHNIKITFNTLKGWLGLRAIDSTDDLTFICFDYKDNFKYDWGKNIKASSRHFSLIDISVPLGKRKEFLDACNSILKNLRIRSADILLTPFKGNTHKGMRRRRLDFKLARAIMETAFSEVCGGLNEQQSLF